MFHFVVYTLFRYYGKGFKVKCNLLSLLDKVQLPSLGLDFGLYHTVSGVLWQVEAVVLVQSRCSDCFVRNSVASISAFSGISEAPPGSLAWLAYPSASAVGSSPSPTTPPPPSPQAPSSQLTCTLFSGWAPRNFSDFLQRSRSQGHLGLVGVGGKAAGGGGGRIYLRPTSPTQMTVPLLLCSTCEHRVLQTAVSPQSSRKKMAHEPLLSVLFGGGDRKQTPQLHLNSLVLLSQSFSIVLQAHKGLQYLCGGAAPTFFPTWQ